MTTWRTHNRRRRRRLADECDKRQWSRAVRIVRRLRASIGPSTYSSIEKAYQRYLAETVRFPGLTFPHPGLTVSYPAPPFRGVTGILGHSPRQVIADEIFPKPQQDTTDEA